MQSEPPRVPRVRAPRHTDPSAVIDRTQDLFFLSLTRFRWITHPELRRHFLRMAALVLSLAGAAWGSWKLAQWFVTVL